MLDKLKIQNFRVFGDTTIERFADVNLIVGRNNSGKSCLLEALRVYAGKASYDVLLDLIKERDEYRDLHTQKGEIDRYSAVDNPLRYLFNGYHFPMPGKDGVCISSSEPEKDTLRLYTKWYQRLKDGTGNLLDATEPTQENIEDLELRLVADYAGQRNSSYSLGDIRENLNRRVLIHNVVEANNVQFVAAQSAADESIPVLWDMINLTDLESEVTECLKIIDPRTIGVAVIGNGHPKGTSVSGRFPIVRLEGSDERIPLRSMGDGMLRLFHIILALVNAKNGMLLIDEFENGVHWSVQPKIWDVIFRLAKQLNVQVFATTHSKDCVSAFVDIWNMNRESGGFLRLEVDDERGVVSTCYGYEDLFDAIDTDVEVR